MKNGTISTFATKLQVLIAKSGKKLNTLSEEIGISSGALSNYQNGNAEPGLCALKKISDYFDVSLDYLFGKARCKKPKNEEISKRFGLTEKAIMNLEKAKQTDESVQSELLTILNLLLEEEEFFYSLKTIKYYLNAINVPQKNDIEGKLFERFQKFNEERISLFGENSVLLENEAVTDFYFMQSKEKLGDTIKKIAAKKV